eukprot:gnl/MRDRNA2_/MRDRNA2_151063_c0_seq1.p1 gnl/MRDRNA2_/MRDRNA2_151063_c0~~gnl/MRDRNA2_/MRDRNA2_151063_c0_seq1.p1  ORF type:complete len:251 (+),score=37.81 gnl/MRDRNA2_/MRDRNA2_151063_c0_seq1:107-859(+)
MSASRMSHDRHSSKSNPGPTSSQESKTRGSKQGSKQGSQTRSRSSGSIRGCEARSRSSGKGGTGSNASERRSRSSSHGGYSGSLRSSDSMTSRSHTSIPSNLAAKDFLQNRRFGVKMSGYREDQIVPGFSGFHGREDSFADNVGSNARKNARSQVPENAKYFLACYLRHSGDKEGYAGSPSNLTDQAKFDLPGIHCVMGELRGKAARHPGADPPPRVPFPDVIGEPVIPWRRHSTQMSIITWHGDGDGKA